MTNNSLLPLPTIDFHTHLPLSPVTFFTPEEKKIPSFEDYLKALDAAHVIEAVLLCGPKKLAMRRENEALAKRIEALQSRFLLIAWLNPKYDSPDDLQELVETHKFRGLKLHPVIDQYQLNDPLVNPFIEKAIMLKIPIMIHSGWGAKGKIKDIGKLAETHSDGTFVSCHMKEEFNLNDRFSHIEMAVHHSNVFLECSYIPHPRRLAEAVDVLGSKRILFGSDYPWGARDIVWEKNKVLYADIPLSAKKDILQKNAQKIFHS
ncbi:MAG: amidohydrolase family protein [Candidatus Hodarchaeales archaeon]